MILLIGLNHKTAPLAVREKLFAGCEEKQNLLSDVLLMPGVQEVLYISTCNRVELVCVMDGEKETIQGAKRFLSQSGGLTDQEVAPHQRGRGQSRERSPRWWHPAGIHLSQPEGGSLRSLGPYWV